jgi:hypothetical protein
MTDWVGQSAERDGDYSVARLHIKGAIVMDLIEGFRDPARIQRRPSYATVTCESRYQATVLASPSSKLTIGS